MPKPPCQCRRRMANPPPTHTPAVRPSRPDTPLHTLAARPGRPLAKTRSLLFACCRPAPPARGAVKKQQPCILVAPSTSYTTRPSVTPGARKQDAFSSLPANGISQPHSFWPYYQAYCTRNLITAPPAGKGLRATATIRTKAEDAVRSRCSAAKALRCQDMLRIHG